MERARYHIFTYCHPAVIFLYFVAVIGCAMITLSPIYVALSLLGGAVYAIYLKGVRAWAKQLAYLIPLFIVIATINPLFSGMGTTPLLYVGDTIITREALVYGVCSAGMLISVVQWFSCYQEVMTSEKFLALFGGIMQTTALMISMVLRYIPLVSRKASQIQLAQAVSLGMEKPPLGRRIREGARMASVLMSWSMESSIETSDSMRARGYGESVRRTHVTNERLTTYDVALLVALALMLLGNAIAIVGTTRALAFYPTLDPATPAWPVLILYIAMLLFPFLLEGREQLSWLTARR